MAIRARASDELSHRSRRLLPLAELRKPEAVVSGFDSILVLDDSVAETLLVQILPTICRMTGCVLRVARFALMVQEVADV